MTTENYVSFETANLLKEKGFEQVNCHRQYNTDGMLCNGYCYGPMAPTLQMAMKWLREVYKLHINLDIHWLYFADTLGWMYTVTKILENGVDYVCSNGDENDKTFYSSYEEACEAAIKYCLENLI